MVAAEAGKVLRNRGRRHTGGQDRMLKAWAGAAPARIIIIGMSTCTVGDTTNEKLWWLYHLA